MEFAAAFCLKSVTLRSCTSSFVFFFFFSLIVTQLAQEHVEANKQTTQIVTLLKDTLTLLEMHLIYIFYLDEKNIIRCEIYSVTLQLTKTCSTSNTKSVLWLKFTKYHLLIYPVAFSIFFNLTTIRHFYFLVKENRLT